MAKAIKRRRGTTEDHKTFVGLDGEITVDTTKKTLVIHDQETVGGFPMASEAMLNEAAEKIEEETEQTFVHKSGDTMTGSLVISGNFVTESVFLAKNKLLEKGTIPANNEYINVEFADKTGSTQTGRLGAVYTSVRSNGSSFTAIQNFKNEAGSTTASSLSIGFDASGNPYTSAPTPPLTNNSSQIATTNWVRQAFPDWLSLNPATSINADDQAAIHNGIYRGKNLTNVYTLEQLSAKLQAGDFTDLYIGDYITKPFTYNGTTVNVNWRFAHFNYFKYLGETSLTKNHIVMVPDTLLFSSQMNTSNTSAGGILATIVWGLLQGDVYNAVNAANCINGHVLVHNDYFPVTVDTNALSAAGSGIMGSTSSVGLQWVNVKLGLIKENMFYGLNALASSGRELGVTKSQLSLFNLDQTWIGGRDKRQGPWIGNVTGVDSFASVDGGGVVASFRATSNRGVRPYFLFA